MSKSTKEFDTFQQAQHPIMWVGVADELADAAEPILDRAVSQIPAFEIGKQLASEEAEREFRESGDFGQGKIRSPAPEFLPAFFLYGFAIENLFKALYVTKNVEAIGKERIGVPAHHDLKKLAREAEFSPNAEEATLLEKLTTITSWSGRYPVALTKRVYGNTPLSRDTIFSDPIAAGQSVRQLFAKLRALVDPKPRDRSTGGMMVIWREDEECR